VRRGRGALAALGALCLLLLGARIAAPVFVQRYVNRVLDRTHGYSGHIGDVDLSLWRGAYTIEDVAIVKTGGKVPVPFFESPQVDLSIEWRALFEGSLVGEIWMERPQLNFVAAERKKAQQTGSEADWRKTVRDLFPFKINRLTVRNGSVHFRNFESDPPVDAALQDVQLVVRNLTNSKDLREELPARAEASARFEEGGRLAARLGLDPFAAKPTFDFDGQLTAAPLAQWNDFLRAYTRADVQGGTLNVYAELSARGGQFDGYAKPFFEHVDVLDVKEELPKKGILSTLWQALVGGTAEVVEDQTKDRIATRIPIHGSSDDPQIGFWTTLGNVLRNAFIQSFVPALEHSVGKDAAKND
jgi:Domain of Unknown Function (DUF748)